MSQSNFNVGTLEQSILDHKWLWHHLRHNQLLIREDSSIQWISRLDLMVEIPLSISIQTIILMVLFQGRILTIRWFWDIFCLHKQEGRAYMISIVHSSAKYQQIQKFWQGEIRPIFSLWNFYRQFTQFRHLTYNILNFS